MFPLAGRCIREPREKTGREEVNRDAPGRVPQPLQGGEGKQPAKILLQAFQHTAAHIWSTQVENHKFSQGLRWRLACPSGRLRRRQQLTPEGMGGGES